MNNVIFYDDNNTTPNQYTENYNSILTITQKDTNNIQIYEIIIINRNLDENERDSLYNYLYYENNDIQIPKIIKTINEDGYNTIGFGAIVNGGTSAKENYNNINLPGLYKGYEVSNDYVLINDQYNNKEIVSDITNGGTGYSGLNYDNNIYNGQKGFQSDSIINQGDLSSLPTEYSYGAPSYDINKESITYGKNGNGTDISTLISENYSGSGSVGGINNIFSKYPIINNSINKNILRLSTTSDTYDINIYDTIIKIDIASEFNVIMIDSNTTTGKYIDATINLNPGNYKIIINNNDNHIKFCNNDGITLLVDSKKLDTEDMTGWSNIDTLQNNYISSYDQFYCKLIKLTLIEKEEDEEDLTFDDSDTNFYYNFDETKSGSGIIILKYNIKKDVVNTIEDKFDKRLKLLEEALLFSRINTYSDNKESIMFFKNNEITKYYNNMFIDQSYTGIFVDLTDKNEYNTVEENFIFKWSIKYNLEDNYRDYVPNTNSKNINFITNTHLIKFNDYLHIPVNKYVYIDNVNLEINDTIYNYNNNAYVSKIEYKNINITPIKTDIFPINNFKYKSDDLLTQTEITIDNNLIKWSSHNESYDAQSDKYYPLNIFNHNIK